jgi:hypothetical protein
MYFISKTTTKANLTLITILIFLKNQEKIIDSPSPWGSGGCGTA